jgi:hypothetical protein
MNRTSLSLALSLAALLGTALLAPAVASAHDRDRDHRAAHPSSQSRHHQGQPHNSKWAVASRREGRRHGQHDHFDHYVRLHKEHSDHSPRPVLREQHDHRDHRDHRVVRHRSPIQLSIGYEIVL